MSHDVTSLTKKLGYEFKTPELLHIALTHCSARGENNERLEFLGDAILNFIIASALFERWPKAKEGQLTRLRASLVKGETLAQIAREFDLGKYLRMGSGESRSGGRARTSILADAMEAIVGAIYLDSGFEVCSEHVLRWYEARLQPTSLFPNRKDPKTELQEYLQGKRLAIPRYVVTQTEGDVHDQVFYVECRIEELEIITQGHGTSRRRAEQQAADQALTLIQQRNKLTPKKKTSTKRAAS